MTNNGFIDVQGANNANGAVDNKFINLPTGGFHSYAATMSGVATNGGLSPFYIRNTINFAMTNNGFDAFPPVSVKVDVHNISSPSSYHNDCGGGSSSLALSSDFSDLTNKIANPGLYTAALVRENHTSKRQLYQQLVNTLAAPNSTLQAFKTANATSSLNRLTMVDSTITIYFDGDTTALPQAKNYNTFVSNNTVEAYQQQFNDLYLTFLKNGNLNTTEIGQLNAIAHLCPYTDGTAVWQARSFAKLFNDSLEYFNVCESINPPTVSSAARMGNFETADASETELLQGKLIPNPNDGNFTLLLDKEVEILSIEVIDVSGKTVCDHKIEHTNTIKISCSQLVNGVYLVKVFVNGEFNQTKRLIITK